jgi:hypothetical protein
MSLEYISYEEYKAKGYPLDRIEAFDSGNCAFNAFLSERLIEWQEKLSGVTYLLIDTEEKNKSDIIIYAYATVSTIGLLSKDADNYAYISGVEIRLFAIDRHFRDAADETGVKYSHVFFALLLQDLWSAATTKISFKIIFLQSNLVGKSLYEDFGFVEVSDYIAPTEDDKIEVHDCIPMLCEITDEMMYQIFE